MQSLPMDAPRRSFVMSAPTPMPVRARPNLALRAPNWVYADAASVAALFLAVTISVDATGGLTSDPLRQDTATTSSVTPAALTIESLSSGEDTSVASEAAGPPESLAAAAVAAAPAPESDQGEQIGGGVATYGASATPVPLGSSAPVVSAARAADAGEAAITEASLAQQAAPVPEDGGFKGPPSEPGSAAPKANEVYGPARTSSPPVEPTVPDLITEIRGGDTSTRWRLLEVAAGVLAVGSLAGLALRWRAGRD